MESKFHELKSRLLKNIDQTSESRLYMDIQLAQNCETLMSIIKRISDIWQRKVSFPPA